MINSMAPMAQWETGDSPVSLREEFLRSGAVLLRGIASPDQLLTSLAPLGEIYSHVDSRNDGLTHIKSGDTHTNRDSADTNRAGFTERALVPHTDRSGIDNPPHGLAFWIEEQSSVGGSSLFIDGYRLFEEISAKNPAALESLMRPGSVVFKSERGLVEGSIFAWHNGRLRIRFRYDRMVYMSPDVGQAMPTFLAATQQLQAMLQLEAGDGYLIDNRRWLHGRTYFVGFRSAYRLLFDEIA